MWCPNIFAHDYISQVPKTIKVSTIFTFQYFWNTDNLDIWKVLLLEKSRYLNGIDTFNRYLKSVDAWKILTLFKYLWNVSIKRISVVFHKFQKYQLVSNIKSIHKFQASKESNRFKHQTYQYTSQYQYFSIIKNYQSINTFRKPIFFKDW